MEAAIRWLPHHNGGERRFLVVDVANGTAVLNSVDDIGKRNLSYQTIAKADKLPNFGAYDHSKTDPTVVAFGLVSGSANLIKLREHGAAEVITSFRVRQQRKCNSINLSSQNWLAVALDKTRSDVCLNIYDATAGVSQDPIRRLCAAEFVSSVRFFPSRPQEIVAAAQRAFIRVYDLRDPLNTGASLQAATKNANNIAIDPLDENYFASAGSTDDPCVTVWDRRWMPGQSSSASILSTTGVGTGAVFDFRPAVDNTIKTTVWSIRYSGLQRGRLALCSSTGELKIIDMVESSSTLMQESAGHALNNPFGGSPWVCNRYVEDTRSLEKPYHHRLHSKERNERIIAFDWVHYDNTSPDQAILALRPSREIDVLRMPFSKPHALLTGRADIMLHHNDQLAIAEPKSRGSEAATPSKRYQRSLSIAAEDFGPLEYRGEMDLRRHDDESRRLKPDAPALASMLAPLTTARERCRNGYLFDCQKNMELVGGDWPLERLWEIIGRFKQQAKDDGMLYKSLDLAYFGVSGIWSERVGSSPHRRVSSSHTSMSEAIVGLINAKDIPAFEGERTSFPEHRQLCLMVCGWKFTPDELEEECQELIDRGLYYQAIVQAVLHDYKHIALNLFRTLIRSKSIPHTGVNALLAADQINDEQRDMCEWMAADTDDPALKALLRFLITGDWRDVMKTTYLHLGYRVALGLKYLNDTELSGFIQSETARAVKNGDLEGILLTGLTEQSMDLLQIYVTKTNDLQTAVVASAFTNPLYVDDVRWNMWKETYFLQMHAWRCFVERAKFTVQHNRMAKTRDGQSLIDAPAKQVQIRCIHCNSAAHRHTGSFMNGHPPSKSKPSVVRISGPAAAAGTVCPTCGRHMPRCGICLRWLGTPDPRTTGAERELEKLEDAMAKFLTFCVACGHGFHADHAQMWFMKHSVCPVPDCDCLCGIN